MILSSIDFGAWFVYFAEHALEVITAFVILFAAVLLMFRVMAKPQPPLGPEMIGKLGVALTDVSGLEGRVKVGDREIRAIAEDKIRVGSTVRVREVDGLIAKVEPAAAG